VLRPQLEAMQDPRAQAIAALLSKRPPDIVAVESIVVGDAEPAEHVDIRSIAALELPAREVIDRAYDVLGEAVDVVGELEATDADRSDALARLLSEAL